MILKCDVTASMARIVFWESYIVGQRKGIISVEFEEVRADLRSLVLLLISIKYLGSSLNIYLVLLLPFSTTIVISYIYLVSATEPTFF